MSSSRDSLLPVRPFTITSPLKLRMLPQRCSQSGEMFPEVSADHHLQGERCRVGDTSSAVGLLDEVTDCSM